MLTNYGLIVLISYALIPVIKTFNLDITSPDIRIGPSDSLFGFSVVLSSTKSQWYVTDTSERMITFMGIVRF